MRDFAFYNAGVDDATGPKRVVGLARRLLRRILRPMLYRQEAIYRDLQGQIDRLSEQVDALGRLLASTDAFGWDHVAMARRLAAIEDLLAEPRPEAGPAAGPDLGLGRRVDAGDRLPAPHAGPRVAAER